MRPPVPHGPSLAAVALISLLSPIPGASAAMAQAAGGGNADTAYFNSYHSAPRDTVSPVVYQGFKQFALNCARCHGDFGVGTTFAPALVESVKPTGTIPTVELFIQTVCAGRVEKGMPAWCTLGLEIPTMQAIHAYLIERSTGRVGPGRPAQREAQQGE
jgi:mono/diheme cytochrome c family protein